MSSESARRRHNSRVSRDQRNILLPGDNEGHGFRKKQNVDYQFYATVRFVKEYLLK